MLLQISGCILLILGWLIPDHYFPWVSFYNEFFAGAGICVIAATLLRRKMLALPVAILCPAILLACALGIDTLLGRWLFLTDLYAGVLWIGLWLVAGVVGANCAQAAISHGQRPSSTSAPVMEPITLLGMTLVLGALGNLFAGTVQWLDLPTGLYVTASSGRAISNLAQPNHYATLLAMGIASLGYLRSRHLIGPVVLWVTAGMFALGIFTSDSRTGLLCLLFILLLWLARACVIRNWTSVSHVGLALLLLLVVKVNFKNIAMPLGAGEGRDALNFQSDSRLLIWRQLMAAVIDRPWAGYGWLQVSAGQDAMASQYPGARLILFAHSLPLDIALWFGIPASLAAVLLGTIWVFRHMNLKCAATFHSMAMLLPPVLHSLLEFPHAYAYFIIPMGALVGHISATKPVRERYLPAKGLPVLLLFCASLGVAFFLIQRQAEEPIRTAMSGARTGSIPFRVAPVLLIGDDIDALIRTLADTYAREPGALERTRRVALRYPRLAVRRQYVIALVTHGKDREACRQLDIFKAAYGDVEFGKLQRSIGVIFSKQPSCQ